MLGCTREKTHFNDQECIRLNFIYISRTFISFLCFNLINFGIGEWADIYLLPLNGPLKRHGPFCISYISMRLFVVSRQKKFFFMTMAHMETQTWASQCYDVSTLRSSEEHRAWEPSNQWEWEKKRWDGKSLDIRLLFVIQYGVSMYTQIDRVILQCTVLHTSVGKIFKVFLNLLNFLIFQFF